MKCGVSELIWALGINHIPDYRLIMGKKESKYPINIFEKKLITCQDDILDTVLDKIYN